MGTVLYFKTVDVAYIGQIAADWLDLVRQQNFLCI